jgi:PadR family transcriptional regulator PadR
VGKQMTEMLKGTLEGIVLAILSTRPAYGYEITARLREMGFTDIAEGTVYAGQAYLEEFWRTWGFLSGQLQQLRDRED